MKKPLIVLTGPTAVGKTDLSIKLAQRINGVIISADSMQVYRGMDIGCAKISTEEMEGVPHYLLDVLEPDEPFHAARFRQMAKEAIHEVHSHGNIPILAGGTGFYIQAAVYDIDFTEHETDLSYRSKLEEIAKEGERGIQMLYEELKKCDPLSAERIHPNNVKRVIRALEYYHAAGSPISKHNDEQAQKESPYQFAYFVLTDDRQAIYDRIDRRVDKMMEEGLLEEVKALRNRGFTRQLVSMQGLGYKELLSCLDGEYPLEEAVRIIKRDTRHFAKRQLTWFARERDVRWIDRRNFSSGEDMIDEMIRQLTEAGIL